MSASLIVGSVTGRAGGPRFSASNWCVHAMGYLTNGIVKLKHSTGIKPPATMRVVAPVSRKS
jgi:hypothetical protein